MFPLFPSPGLRRSVSTAPLKLTDAEAERLLDAASPSISFAPPHEAPPSKFLPFLRLVSPSISIDGPIEAATPTTPRVPRSSSPSISIDGPIEAREIRSPQGHHHLVSVDQYRRP